MRTTKTKSYKAIKAECDRYNETAIVKITAITDKYAARQAEELHRLIEHAEVLRLQILSRYAERRVCSVGC